MTNRPKSPAERITANVNQLVSHHTEARAADAGIFYPITPSTEGGELYQQSFAEGLLNPDTLRWAAYNIPLVFIGTAIGTYLNRRISSKLFNRILIVFVLLTGLKLIARAWN